jgi:hypothetical protein
MFSIIFAVAVLLNHTYVSDYGAVYAASSIIYPIIMITIANRYPRLLASIELIQEVFLLLVISPHRVVVEVTFLYYLVVTYTALVVLMIRSIWKQSVEVEDDSIEHLV